MVVVVVVVLVVVVVVVVVIGGGSRGSSRGISVCNSSGWSWLGRLNQEGWLVRGWGWG